MLLDLVPVDIVSSLILAATAAAAGGEGQRGKESGAGAGVAAAGEGEKKGVVIYHATTSSSHPLHLPEAMTYLAKFFKSNPAPVRLPFTR
jgi:hypothetical protein